MFRRWGRKPRALDERVAAELQESHARLEARVKQANASTDADFAAEVADEVFSSLRTLLPIEQNPLVSGCILDRTRWVVVLASQLPRPPWKHIAVAGSLYSGVYTLSLDQATLKLQTSDWDEEQRLEFTGIIFSMMTAGRDVLSMTAYSWHQVGVPGLAGSIVETGTGTLFDTDQLVTGLRSVTSDQRELLRLARSHKKQLRKLKNEDLPNTHFLPAAEANALNAQYFARQIEAVGALPTHLRLLAADVNNVTTHMAALTTARDVVYLVITFRGSCAIRYSHDPAQAPHATSIEIDSLTSTQTQRWVDDAAHAYGLFRRKMIDEHSLSHTLRRILTAVGNHIFAPIFDNWPDLERFTLIPSDAAAALPLFAALIDDEPVCGRYDFTVCPSARAMYTAAQFAAAPPTTALVAADPSEGDTHIPFSSEEAERIAALYGTDVIGPRRTDVIGSRRTASPTTSTDRSLRALTEGSSPTDVQPLSAWADLDAGILRPVIHFACHGVVSDFPDPDAQLVLGHGVSLSDFMGENARPISPGGVVVLSACSVGGVAATAPSELIGFPTVLLNAGVRNVIAPLWPVLDSPETVELMIDLHRGMRAGLAPNMAVAHAIHTSFANNASSAVWGVFASYGC